MKTGTSFIFAFIGLLSLTTPCISQEAETHKGKEYGNPKAFEKEIQDFESADKKQFPPAGAILCVGSSSIRHWHGEIKKDLSPLTVIPRGFGGSNMNDLLFYTDRIVLPYKPRAVVLYEGDNDIAQGIAPEKIASTFQDFVTKLHDKFPDCRVYYLSIKPSLSRWSLWPKMQEANTLIATQCAQDKLLNFVDVSTPMLNNEGKPREEIFMGDKLHMNRAGYVIWRDSLKPILIKSELQYEGKN